MRPKILLLVAILMLACCVDAHAQELVKRVDDLARTFRTLTTQWEPALHTFGQRTFWTLATIEFAWAWCEFGLRHAAVPSWGEIWPSMIMLALTIGFFQLAFEQIYVWGPAIINSIRGAATQAVGNNTFSPGAILAHGVEVFGKIMNKVSFYHPETGMALVIVAFVFGILIALIAGLMIKTIIESYFLTAAAGLFMAAGALRWTRDIAITTLRTFLSIGAKLFAMQLIVGTGFDMMDQAVTKLDGPYDMADLGAIAGLAVILLMITFSVPNTIAGLIPAAAQTGTGAPMGAAGPVASAAGAVAGVVTGGVGAVAGAISTTAHAANLANAQLEAGGGSSSGPMALASFAGRAAGNMASAAASDLGGVLSGQRPFGTTAWRQSSDLAGRAGELRAMTSEVAATAKRETVGRISALGERAAAASAGQQRDASSQARANLDNVMRAAAQRQNNE